MRVLLSFLKGLSLGMGTMYLFDPALGRRRRAMLLDQAEAQGTKLRDFVARGMRDLGNQAYGIGARLWTRLRKGSAPTDVVAERVRSIMGRHVTHPRAIDVSVNDERIILRGAILASEVQPFLRAVESVCDITRVDNQLDVHDTPDVPDLMAEGRHRPSSTWLGIKWTPGIKLLAGASIIGATACLARSRTTRLALLSGLGLGMLSSTRGSTSAFPPKRRRVTPTGDHENGAEIYRPEESRVAAQ